MSDSRQGGLAAFLADRYDEAEALAGAATPGPWRWDNSGDREAWSDQGPWLRGGDEATGRYVIGAWGHDAYGVNIGDGDAAHIAACDPAHRLADIALKRAILRAWPDPSGNWSAEQAEAARAMKERVLRQLGTEFASHPGYDPAWAPTA